MALLTWVWSWLAYPFLIVREPLEAEPEPKKVWYNGYLDVPKELAEPYMHCVFALGPGNREALHMRHEYGHIPGFLEMADQADVLQFGICGLRGNWYEPLTVELCGRYMASVFRHGTGNPIALALRERYRCFPVFQKFADDIDRLYEAAMTQES